MTVLRFKSEKILYIHKSDQKAMKEGNAAEDSGKGKKILFPIYTSMEFSPFNKLVYRH